MTPPKGKNRVDEDVEEQSMSDEGVGNLFSGGGGGSSSALAGWATPAPAQAQPVAPVTPVPAPAAAPTVIPQPAREAAQEPAQEPLDDADTAKPVGFYVSQNVAGRFRKYRKQNDVTHTQIVLMAVEAAAEKGLAQVVEEARRAPKFQSKLFAVTVRPDDTDLRGLGPVQLQYKPTRAQRAIIDGLVRESGLPDHTKFLAIVLDQYLPGRRDV
ncbi:hypothetical protein E6P78_11170 [Streptomyces sp. A0958]|uniref:hypothetical protein n=1 Tax=Streptomyces sp. A0958 TaxID=2563101 RepID=UPI00109EBB1E|nr:hypothetical protein [Streptomyces sp. A0958]THA69988.1 hypothetical protein E6P78_11170 [Streptomyces sp. A0958]